MREKFLKSQAIKHCLVISAKEASATLNKSTDGDKRIHRINSYYLKRRIPSSMGRGEEVIFMGLGILLLFITVGVANRRPC